MLRRLKKLPVLAATALLCLLVCSVAAAAEQQGTKILEACERCPLPFNSDTYKQMLSTQKEEALKRYPTYNLTDYPAFAELLQKNGYTKLPTSFIVFAPCYKSASFSLVLLCFSGPQETHYTLVTLNNEKRTSHFHVGTSAADVTKNTWFTIEMDEKDERPHILQYRFTGKQTALIGKLVISKEGVLEKRL